MPLSFAPALPNDAHYIVAGLTEVWMEPGHTLCPRVVVIFASGVVNGFEVMRYAQQTLQTGSVPVMEQIFRNPDQVSVWSRGFALGDGLIEGSVIAWLCDTYKLDTGTALAPDTVDQYTFQMEFHLLHEYLDSSEFNSPVGAPQTINVAGHGLADR